MSGAIANRVVVYISGVRVDPVSVSVTTTRSGYPSFSVTVPGIPEWDILQPRSHGVVFYADPVSGLWRMLVEGEYISDNKVKTSAGQRHCVLNFRASHGIFETARNSSLGIGCSPDIGDNSVLPKALDLVVNGRRIRPTNQAKLDMPNTVWLLDTVTNTSTTAAEFFPQLMRYVLSQMPVEAYYMYERRLVEKMFSMSDDQIVKVIDIRRMQALKDYGKKYTDENTTLAELVSRYEAMFLYQHICLLAPPLYGDLGGLDRQSTADRTGISAEVRIPELLFTPYLYDVIPPACNVIFQDQLQTQNRARDFASEPTRVITKLNSGTGRDLTSLYMANSVTDSFDANPTLIAAYQGSNPGWGASHDLLSGDELNRGVIGITVPVGLEQVETDVSSSSKGQRAVGDPPTSWDSYWDNVTRHYFAEVGGRYRTAQLSCIFLPMLVPGAPCLVEDYTGPFHGYIESVSHILSNDAAPITSVAVSHVRPAFYRDGIDVTPPLPTWLSTRYRPSGIRGTIGNGESAGGTWSKVLGNNANDLNGGQKHAAMVPEALIVPAVPTSVVSIPLIGAGDPAAFASEQVNLDDLAGKVIPVQKFTKDYRWIETTTNTIAEKLREKPDPNLAMAAYNWRPGLSISHFAKFHNLVVPDKGVDIDSVTTGAPPDLLFDPSALDTTATPFFAAPLRMRFLGTKSINENDKLLADGLKYGGYTLEQVGGLKYNPARQRAMLTIRDAIARRITRS